MKRTENFLPLIFIVRIFMLNFSNLFLKHLNVCAFFVVFFAISIITLKFYSQSYKLTSVLIILMIMLGGIPCAPL